MEQAIPIKLILISLIINCAVAQESKTLFVHVIFRHGDRSPLKAYPSDPYGHESYWPNGFAQLTNRGKAQQYELGRWLRNRYKGFLPEKYSLNDIFVLSTDYDRTLMSALSNLAGLYPPIGTDVWNTNVTWQPIPVHTTRMENEAVTSEPKFCQRYIEEIKNLNENPEIMSVKEEMEPLRRMLANVTGSENIELSTIVSIYDNLLIQSIYNFKLPEWSKQVFPYPLKKYYDWSFKLDAYTHQLKRIRTGILLNEIINRMINKTRNELVPNRKMWIYSGHDSTVANLLNTMDNFDPPFSINYASAIIIELLQQNGSYYVSTLYKNDTSISTLKVRGCEQLCPLDRFTELFMPFLVSPTDWDHECVAVPVPKVLTIIGIIGICLGCALVLIFLGFCCRRMYLNRHKVNTSQ